MPKQQINIVDSLDRVSAEQWDALAGPEPLVSHAFLSALETTGCIGEEAGWLPAHVLLLEGKQLTGAMPLYIKTHSYGEYVFDWAWADAYHRNGLRYYPKLVSAVPFTPVRGPRLLARNADERRILVEAALELARQTKMSSLHCLFPSADEIDVWRDCGMMTRRTVQFHWQNDGFADFDDFLSHMNHNKRKKIRQERRRLSDNGVTCERIPGNEATAEDWLFFNKCYRRTYREHLSTPYLNLDFFRTIGESIPDNLLLIFARHDGERIAAALNVIGNGAMYGRYWGTMEFQRGLHFEVCYYQGIEHCIAHGIGRFEGGAQGEHKLARGLMATEAMSAHWLAHPEFAQAIEDYLRRETSGIANYVDELNERSPFKQSPADNNDK
ncbi:MAG: N-acetyltransferase [Betaproteobacteria bacterium]|nr:MAG: N-acetyltransferase [Betaproteobacteria bacterium]